MTKLIKLFAIKFRAVDGIERNAKRKFHAPLTELIEMQIKCQKKFEL